jgi:cytochrome c oxidase subunit 2
MLDGVQSALAPAGVESARIAELFWWMAGGALLIWFAVVALAFYCAAPDQGKPGARLLIVGGGVVVPVIVLAALLIYGLTMLPPLVARAPGDALQVSVVGEQWWWRVRYERDGLGAIELANELRLPVGQRVQLRLASDNVIHSFWVPSLGGKMDMIPGRITYLALQPTATGIFRGVCAEYCGASHAQMAFYVEVMERDAFDRWLAHQATPAPSPDGDREVRGAELFLANGCSACHRIAGTPATGSIGPDLTHLAGRHSIAAGVLPTTAEALRQWLADTTRIKPGAHMPAFGMLPDADLEALAAYLGTLE